MFIWTLQLNFVLTIVAIVYLIGSRVKVLYFENKMYLQTFLLEFSFVKTLVQFFKAMTYVAALKEAKSGSGMQTQISFKNVILIGWRAEEGYRFERYTMHIWLSHFMVELKCEYTHPIWYHSPPLLLRKVNC